MIKHPFAHLIQRDGEIYDPIPHLRGLREKWGYIPFPHLSPSGKIYDLPALSETEENIRSEISQTNN